MSWLNGSDRAVRLASGVAAAAVENKLKDKIAEKLGLLGKPAEPAASSTPAPEAAQKPEDKIKQKLRGLLGR